VVDVNGALGIGDGEHEVLQLLVRHVSDSAAFASLAIHLLTKQDKTCNGRRRGEEVAERRRLGD
jgi:hypothetical protein